MLKYQWRAMKVSTEVEITIPVPVKVTLKANMKEWLVDLGDVEVEELTPMFTTLKDSVQDYINTDLDLGDNDRLRDKLILEFNDAYEQTAEDEDQYYKLNAKLDVY